MTKTKRAQSAIEYAVLIAVIVAAMVGMNLYVRRSVQANLKMTENRINRIDWTFKDFTTGYPPGPSCRGQGEPCDAESDCCGALECNNGTCRPPQI